MPWKARATSQHTCYPLCGHKKDDSKKISILKKGIGIESEKLWKQDRDQETS